MCLSDLVHIKPLEYKCVYGGTNNIAYGVSCAFAYLKFIILGWLLHGNKHIVILYKYYSLSLKHIFLGERNKVFATLWQSQNITSSLGLCR